MSNRLSKLLGVDVKKEKSFPKTKMFSRVGLPEKSNPRIPRKPGQPAGSKKHSDLYTDENPKGTIHGLGFKDVETARASIRKIENSGKTHAHKVQAAVAMEQRAKEMGKTAEAKVYRDYIEKMKEITKQKQQEEVNNTLQKAGLIDANEFYNMINGMRREIKYVEERVTRMIKEHLPKEQFNEQVEKSIDLRAEFDRFRTNISQKIASMDMSGSGSGEVLLNRLDDVDDTDKADGKLLKFNATTGKLEYESDIISSGTDLGGLT